MHILLLTLKNSLIGETEKPLLEEKLYFKCNAENKEIFEIPLLQIEKSNAKDKVNSHKCHVFHLNLLF